MPNEEAVSPADVTGEQWSPPTAGESQGRVNVARSLGLPDKPTEEELSEEENDETTPKEGQKPNDATAKKAEQTKKQLADNADAVLQRNMEDAYAYALHRARTEEGYLDKLTQSKDVIEQRLAAKLIERNDFGAKNLDEYKKAARIKNAGKDPRDQKIAELEASIEEIRAGTTQKTWSEWKTANAVAGEAAELADQIHTEYPTMPHDLVLATVRGKLGIKSSRPLKESVGFVRGGGSAPEEEGLDLASPLARHLLPDRTRDKTIKFAKQFARGR